MNRLTRPRYICTKCHNNNHGCTAIICQNLCACCLKTTCNGSKRARALKNLAAERFRENCKKDIEINNLKEEKWDLQEQIRNLQLQLAKFQTGQPNQL